MQFELERPELVRCLACRAVYEQDTAPTRAGATGTCPHCGEVAWLAASVPVEEAGAALPA